MYFTVHTVHTVPNPNLLTQSIGKISHRENPCLFLEFFGFFWGVRVVRFFSKFRIQSRMILVNSVPNPKSVAPKLQKLSHCKVSINVAQRTTNDNDTNPATLIVSLKWNFVETKTAIHNPETTQFPYPLSRWVKTCPPAPKVPMTPILFSTHFIQAMGA